MITTNVYQRVFRLKVADSTGTCFTIDVDGRQYVVTARHVIEGWNSKEPLEIFHENRWKSVKFSLVGTCAGEVDIAVLAAPFQLSPTYELPATAAHLNVGQDVYFLGFPYGWYGDLGKMNRDFLMPFVKKAILSCTYFGEDRVQHFYLDGHNNPGFSGGPVVFAERRTPNLFKVASVISGYRYKDEPLFAGEEQLPFSYRYNTGIIVSYGIKHATDLIRSNPVGVQLQDERQAP